jgi:hypothetical protein
LFVDVYRYTVSFGGSIIGKSQMRPFLKQVIHKI